MKRCNVFASLCLAVVSLNALAANETRELFSANDLLQLRRMSEPRLSPDGRYVVFTVRQTDLNARRESSQLWLMDLSTTEREPRQLTRDDSENFRAQWTPDSRSIHFLSTRSGSAQVWRARIADGAATQVTRFPVEVTSFRVSPRGDRLAVSMDVFADCTDLDCTARRLEAQRQSPMRGQVYERLFVRHWDEWKDGRQSHLFAAELRSAGSIAGEPIDLIPWLDADVPSKPKGGEEDYAFSPDGRTLVFSARVKGKSEPWSTNFDLFEVAATGGDLRNLTADRPAWDAQPAFSPDGRWLAWLATERAGFESDRFHLVMQDRKSGAKRHLTDWDRSIRRFEFAPDGRHVLATTDHLGQRPLWSIDVSTGAATPYTSAGEVADFSVGRERIAYGFATLGAPADLYSIASRGGSSQRLTDLNADRLSGRRLGEYEQFSFAGWNDEVVRGYVMKPARFDPGKRYPIAFLIHGGPQVSYANRWDFRWNQQVFAAAGYAVVFIDYHGSPGYGQAFTDAVSGDWGGKPLEDLQQGLAAALARYSWLDGSRACALGPSFGGYLVNWIAGRWPDRFRCLVTHAGTFDTRMDYYSTDELWFEEWEHGATQYERPQNYERHNPLKLVTQWRTPMLITHGTRDFRVPYLHGLATFTALQRKGVESRLLIFPDEGHRIMQPHNSAQWYGEVLAWLDRWLKEASDERAAGH